jgi:hypothetical protein
LPGEQDPNGRGQGVRRWQGPGRKVRGRRQSVE